jgi:hypothetical protein
MLRTVSAHVVDNFDSLVDRQAECRASGNSMQAIAAGSELIWNFVFLL